MLNLVLSSLTTPREIAPKILNWPLSHRELVLAALLIAALSGLADALVRVILPLPEELSGVLVLSPIAIATVQLISIFFVAALIFAVGSVFGGTGSYLSALKASTWISCVGLFISVVTLIVMSFAPGVAQILQLATIFWMLAIFTIFIQELHGFESFFITLACILGTLFAIAVALVILMSVAGLMPEGV